MKEQTLLNQHHIFSPFWLFIALILLIACSDTVNSQVIFDEYGSVQLSKFVGGKITISGVEIDLTAESQIAYARLYLPATEETYEIVVADGQIIAVDIENGAGIQYRKLKRRRRDLKELIESETERWGKHFLGNYYYELAKETIQSASWFAIDKEREIYFPAIEKYKSAIRLDPIFPLSHLNLAYIYFELGAYEQAAKECKLAEKYNLSLVPNLASQQYSDVFGVNRFITSLRQKLQTQYDAADDRIDMSDYKPVEREVKPEEAMREKDAEAFVLSLEKHLNGDDKVRLYNNLGYYYQTKGAYHLSLVNYRKALELKEQNLRLVKPDTISTIYQNMQAVYAKLGWLEAQEISIKLMLTLEKYTDDAIH